MKTLNDSPARYAAQLAEPIGSLHRHLAAEQPDWWRQVVAELEKRLEQEFPETFHCEECGAALYAAFATCEECGRKFNQGADVIPPWKGGSAPETPDWLPGMEYARINAIEARLGGVIDNVKSIGESLDCLEHNGNRVHERIEDLIKLVAKQAQQAALREQRLSALEEWADIDFTAAANNGTPDCIHDLIAEGMTGVTADCETRIAAAIAPLLARLEILENRAPC